jgi:hypothetical protein
MKSIYFNLPNNKSLANIRKNGTKAMAEVIASTFYPELSSTPERHVNTMLPISEIPLGTPHAIIRNPIDRFTSAYAMKLEGKLPGVPFFEINEFISWLIDKDKETLNWHFRPQTIIIGNFNNIKYFNFDKGFNDVAISLGLPVPIPVVNKTSLENKINLTTSQIRLLSDFYKDDLELYYTL